jgi:hypothetical protein
LDIGMERIMRLVLPCMWCLKLFFIWKYIKIFFYNNIFNIF